MGDACSQFIRAKAAWDKVGHDDQRIKKDQLYSKFPKNKTLQQSMACQMLICLWVLFVGLMSFHQKSTLRTTTGRSVVMVTAVMVRL